MATSISAADLDGDGDLDILAGNNVDNTLAWFENDGTGVFGTKEIITACEDGVLPVDVDGDNDLDVVTWGLISAWYENTDGNGTFGEPNIVSTEGPRKVSTADMDGDVTRTFWFN